MQICHLILFLNALSELTGQFMYTGAENSIYIYGVHLQQQLANPVCEESSGKLLWGLARRLLMRD